MAKAPMQIKNDYKINLVASSIADFTNRGQAWEDKIKTVLNDLRDETGLKTLKELDQSKIEQYLESLQDRLESGDLSGSATSTYISALNSIIEYVNEYRNTELEKISAAAWELSRGHQDFQDRSVSEHAHQDFLNWLHQKYESTQNENYLALAYSVELQREFGLRARESFALKIAEKEIGDTLSINKYDLPKNARSREIEIRIDSQKEALKAAQTFAREHGWKSLIAPNMSLKEWKTFAYSCVQEFRQATGHSDYHFHGERHAYAHSLYFSLWEGKTGYKVECPVVVGLEKQEWLSYAAEKTSMDVENIKEIDKEIRLEVSKSLGHNRIDITRTYLG